MAKQSTIYKFDTEELANEFVADQKAKQSPDEDLYIYGPTFFDEDVIFKHMSWASTGKKYWEVTVVTYH